MIFSPCSAEQAQRIKLCPRKSPPQSFPQSHSKPPDISSGGFAVVGRHSPPPKPRGQGPPRMRSIQKALGQPSGGFPCASSKTRRAAGHAQPQGSSRGQGPPRMRSIQKALGQPSGGFLHPLFLLLRIQCTLACFCRRLRQSAIMAMNSEFVGLPLMFETV